MNTILANKTLMNRIKSLLWRVSMMTIAFFVSAITENLEMLELSGQATVFLGLIFGEISKYLNRK
jgi:hypothetical protein